MMAGGKQRWQGRMGGQAWYRAIIFSLAEMEFCGGLGVWERMYRSRPGLVVRYFVCFLAGGSVGIVAFTSLKLVTFSGGFVDSISSLNGL